MLLEEEDSLGLSALLPPPEGSELGCLRSCNDEAKEEEGRRSALFPSSFESCIIFPASSCGLC